MAKQKKPKGLSKQFWCSTGNHSCYRTELAIINKDNDMGLCFACIKKRGGVADYWLTNEKRQREDTRDSG